MDQEDIDLKPDEVLEAGETHAVEVVMNEPEPLAVSPSEVPASDAMSLARMGAQGLELFESRATLLRQCRFVALKNTDPRAWLLSKTDGTDGTEGAVVATFCAPGYPAVAAAYGIAARFLPQDSDGIFRPERVNQQGEVIGAAVRVPVYGYRGFAWGNSAFNGQEVQVQITRMSDEDFIGRQQRDGDLRLTCFTGLKKKLVAELAGITTVPAEELEEAWEYEPGKSVERCRKGHGFGTSSERRGAKVAEDGVPIERQLLRTELLQLTEGVKESAVQLLQEITAYDYQKDGKQIKGCSKSIDAMAKMFQFEKAWGNLRRHPRVGKDATSVQGVQKLRAKLQAKGGS